MPERWYSLTTDEVLTKINSDGQKGLSDKEASIRADSYGPNQLVRGTKVSPLKIFIDQFRDFIVVVLLAATVISGFLGEYADAVTIIIIVVLNGALGYIQEYRAERSMEALKQLAAPEAKIVREGLERKVPAADLVPGDIVLLEEGDRIPADLRILSAVSLEIEESALTGESVPARKKTKAIGEDNVQLGDTRNMAYMGTVVTRGRGRGVVVATGMGTEMGNIAGLIMEAGREETPLQRRLGHMGKWLVFFCLIICAVVAAVGIMRGEEAYQMFLAGVSLAVAAIPEGLPAIVTVSLAVGVQRMARRRAIIRKLPAVETLGCATVICADKTGTLTQNEMTVRKVFVGGQQFEVTGEGYDPKGELAGEGDRRGPEFELFFRAAALCNNSKLQRGDLTVAGLFRGLTRGGPARDWSVSGDPTEGALLVLAAKSHTWREEIERVEPRLAEIPFDSVRKRMTVVYRKPSGRKAAYVKGAPDTIVDICTHTYKKGKLAPLTARDREGILAKNGELAGHALRVLALACRELPREMEDFPEEELEQNLVFLGLAGMIDPPRREAVAAVVKCHLAGIRAVMITGDHQNTARAVAKETGILTGKEQIMSGTELDGLSDSELRRKAEKVTVYARVSPMHKLRIVQALKKNGHVVAMTGDGVNDAPAIKEADIGIAMGVSGTDVTREASAMVLGDDNFTTIVAAVEEGRAIYDNIRKFIRYLLACNTGEVLTMFLAVLAGLPLPLLPIQILWMNLVTDGLPAIALGVDPADRDVMNRPPRHPRESVFAHGLAWRIGTSGLVFAAVSLFSLQIGLKSGGGDLARTMAFNTLVFVQLFYVFSCRSEYRTILDVGLMTNPFLVAAVLVSAGLQLAVVYLPFLQPIFHTVRLNWMHWAFILTASAAPTVFETLIRHFIGRAREKVVYLKV
ncbi:MAG: calcium-translocating P-type ATPase, SERCA-type [Eubacteriales bacterium]